MIAMALDLGPGQKPLAIGVGAVSQFLLANKEGYLTSLRQAVQEFSENVRVKA